MTLEEESIVQRIKKIAFEQEGNISAFAYKIKTNQSTIATAISRGKGVGSEILQKIIEAYPDISPLWLLTGKGEMRLRESDNLLHDKQPTSGEALPPLEDGSIEHEGTTNCNPTPVKEERDKDILFLKEVILSRDVQIEKLLDTIHVLVSSLPKE